LRAKDELVKDDTHKMIKEECAILDKVQEHLGRTGTTSVGSSDYDEELIELRDAIAEARPEDIPPLVEQMTRLQAIAAQRGRGEEIPVNPDSPYFGHLQLKENAQTRDILLGKHTYLAPDEEIRIVDWRNAPVSRMYYCYDEGDDYEEEFGGMVRRGEITARRSVTILEKRLRRIACFDKTLVLKKGEWVKLEGTGPRLSGGQGVAVRAEGLKPVRGLLGVDADGVERVDKHLPEISALLDKEQFEMISSRGSGLMVIQGGAGSGKTTVGLHRIAYLSYQRKKRFRSRNMIVLVFNEALASYVKGVLPALGVHGVRVMTFARWASQLRYRHVRGLPTRYSEWTPSVVSRLKKHPALLRILDDIVDQQDEELTNQLYKTVAGTDDEDRVREAWQTLSRLPLDARRKRMQRWMNGEAQIGRDRGERLHTRTDMALESALGRMGEITEDLISDWADFFTDKRALRRAFEVHAPAEFTDGEIDTVHAWCVKAYAGLDGDADEPAVIDQEDDAILLRLYQLKRGWLRGQGGRLEYDHLMIDEAQDFTALETAVMMDTVGYKRPVTLAGDTAQRIINEGGFDNWDMLLDDLGIQNAEIEMLKIAYRSTIEIMQVAREVLGPLAGEGALATRHGAEVEVHRFSDPGQAVDFISSALRMLANAEPFANVAVIARHLQQAKMYHRGLVKAEVPKVELVTDQDFSFSSGVEVTDIRQVKGLEFDYVILVDVNADSYPKTDESRHLLHVAITRAAHQLWMITTDNPSPLIPPRLLGD